MEHIAREDALALLKKYELGYAEDAEYWGIVGLLHDIDFEQYPEEHCLRAPELPKLLTMTLEAMATCEDEIQAEMRSEE